MEQDGSSTISPSSRSPESVFDDSESIDDPRSNSSPVPRESHRSGIFRSSSMCIASVFGGEFETSAILWLEEDEK